MFLKGLQNNLDHARLKDFSKILINQLLVAKSHSMYGGESLRDWIYASKMDICGGNPFTWSNFDIFVYI